MDQALIQGTFAGLYEKLVADVAAQVVATMAGKAVIVTNAEMRVFEEKIDAALENYDCSEAVDAAIENYDIDSKIEEAVEGLDIDSKIEEAIEDIDWDEKIKEAFCGLRVELVPR